MTRPVLLAQKQPAVPSRGTRFASALGMNVIEHDTHITKVSLETAPQGKMGQRYLASGVTVALRLWEEDRRGQGEQRERSYETVGYVLSGSAILELEGRRVELNPGDSWVIPRGATHRYTILEPLKALEATSPPAHARGRDEPT